LDAFYQGTYRGFQHLPARVAHEFGQLRQPLETSTVSLARYVPPTAGVMLPWARSIKSTPATSKTPPLDVVVATFGFGHLTIQVSIGEWRDPFPYRPFYSLATPLGSPLPQQCWPVVTDNLSWPNSTPITAADFHAIAQPEVILSALATQRS
jgi:hypothetical protein